MQYTRIPYESGRDTSVLRCNRLSDKVVAVSPNLPGNIIVIHGVNDVGTSYDQVEQGLCAGLKARIGWEYVPGQYRMPGADDRKQLTDDPDAVFFKRQASGDTRSPVIPFYWGFREDDKKADTKNGQRTDQHGNRLDKDLSKGGGPFANATSTLPDMWGAGKSKLLGLLDKAQHDATHPVLNNPGRMYMILAAQRLAALIAMIRDYDPNEAVTLVAHSQGGMLSLLAQAILLDAGLRPADTLILNNPPYSLIDDIPRLTSWSEGSSGEDTAMKDQYEALNGRQTLYARLQTLVNIVQGVAQKKHPEPALTNLDDHCTHHGMVSGLWKADKDRDNRGKVYLYFCPEDMTVALSNVQGIGWQGIPDFQRGSRLEQIEERTPGRAGKPTGRLKDVVTPTMLQPMKQLTALNQTGSNGAGFFQRVFTMKKRPDPNSGKPVLVGQAPHDFILRTAGEDDQAHTDTSDSWSSKHVVRGHLPEPVRNNRNGPLPLEQQRLHIRTINGEVLPQAVAANLIDGALADAKGRPGASETVDPIDAAIAVTSDYGLGPVWQCIPEPFAESVLGRVGGLIGRDGKVEDSPQPGIYKGQVVESNYKVGPVEDHLNKGKSAGQRCRVVQVFTCVERGSSARPISPRQVLVQRNETPDEARLRWQNATGSRSFHGAIFGCAENHKNVTAYDVAIGGGKAVTDPLFYKYLCAVADWRLKDSDLNLRPGILGWGKFLTQFGVYWKDELPWRKALIEGNAKYYSSGLLPACVSGLKQGLPSSVICETMNGKRTVSTVPAQSKRVAMSDDDHTSDDEGLA